MDFGWLKKMFKKESTGITNINTSFNNIPKFRELSQDNKKAVLLYMQDIDLKNTESILKYSADLVDKFYKDQSLLFNITNELNGFIESINDKKKNNVYILVNIDYFKEKLELLKRDIQLTEIQTELKVIAIKEYIKNEKKLLFDNEKKQQFIKNKNSLLEEKERLQKLRRIIVNNLIYICSINNSINNNEKINRIKNNYDNKAGFIFIEEEQKRLIKNIDILKKNNKEYNFNNKYNYLEKLIKHNNYYDALRTNAIIDMEIEKYIYDHRNDYKVIINEIDEIVNKYHNTLSSKWNKDEIIKEINKYSINISDYLVVFKKYSTGEIYNELRDSFLRLCNLYVSLTNKYLEDIEEFKPIIEKIANYNGDAYKYYCYALNYYDKLSFELYNSILVNNFQDNDYNNIKDKKGVYRSILDHKQICGLYDIANNYYNGKNTKIFISQDKEKRNDLLFKFINLFELIQLDEDLVWNNIKIDNYISAEDLFYLLKFFKIEKYNLSELVLNTSLNINKGWGYEELVIKTVFNKIKEQYDSRIMIIPNSIDMDNRLSNVFENVLNKINNSNSIALYISNQNQVEFLMNVLNKIDNKIKYIIIPKCYYDLLEKNYKIEDNCINLNINERDNLEIVVVNDNTKYQELSSYLDNALEKNKKYIKHI